MGISEFLVIFMSSFYQFWYCTDAACSKGQFRCKNGKCISGSNYCDGIVDCFDRSDELCDCESRGHFRCARLGYCVGQSKVCDGVNDCGFYEDETNCVNCQGFQCKNGWCLPANRRCDQFSECPGGEDEDGCVCMEGEHRCPEDKLCILSRWLCDGIRDCPSGTDEKPCADRSSCNQGELPCADHGSCIKSEKQCDGTRDCQDGSDEFDCVVITPSGVLLVYEVNRYKYQPVCYDNWLGSESLGQSACSLAGAGSYSSSSYTEASLVAESKHGQFTLDLNSSGSDALLLQALHNSEKPCGMLVVVNCAYDQCGEISSAVRLHIFNTSPRIPTQGSSFRLINAERAYEGEAPWQVNLFYEGVPFCGGTLISIDWVMTAAHCVADDPDPSRYGITLGSLLLEGDDTKYNKFLQTLDISEVIVHQGWDKSRILNDVALLRLKYPASQTDMVRPMCWPNLEDTFDVENKFRECRTSGWGFVDKQATLLPWTLQATRMDLVSNQRCSSVFGSDFQSDMMICAGTVSGIITICSGDSGSPLVCRDNNNVWTLVGVASWSPAQISGYECAGISVFSKMTTYMPWIKQAMSAPIGTYSKSPRSKGNTLSSLPATVNFLTLLFQCLNPILK